MIVHKIALTSHSFPDPIVAACETVPPGARSILFPCSKPHRKGACIVQSFVHHCEPGETYYSQSTLAVFLQACVVSKIPVYSINPLLIPVPNADRIISHVDTYGSDNAIKGAKLYTMYYEKMQQLSDRLISYPNDMYQGVEAPLLDTTNRMQIFNQTELASLYAMAYLMSVDFNSDEICFDEYREHVRSLLVLQEKLEQKLEKKEKQCNVYTLKKDEKS